MNDQAQRHLAKAEGYIVKGDEWYAKAADEIIAAQEADPTLSYRAISAVLGMSPTWCSKVVKKRTNGEALEAPFAGDYNAPSRLAGAKKVLREAPLEQIEKIVSELPAPVAAKLAQASLARPGVTREIAKDAEASATVIRASGQVGEEMVHKAKSRSSVGKASGLGLLVDVLGNLHGAKRKLNESYKAASDLDLSDEHAEAVAELLDEIVLIIDWYRSYLDSGDQSFEEELSKLLS